MVNNTENIKQMVEQLYSDRDKTGDATFIVGSQQIRAHRSVLAALSPKYKAQFYGPNPDQDEIRVPNVSADAFKKFIQFFYKESVDLAMDNIETVLDLAQQSLVDGFVELCVDFLKNSISTSNVCFVYRLATMYGIKELCLCCERHISTHVMDVFASDAFLHCNYDMLTHILKLDTFNCLETDVFRACIAWARTDCRQKGLDEKTSKHLRESLGEAIYQIRFASMTAEEFAILLNCEQLEDFFIANELVELLNVITKLPDFTPKMFTNTPRASKDHVRAKPSIACNPCYVPPPWSLECNRFEHLMEKHVSADDVVGEHFVLVSNHPIRLHGFVLGVRLNQSIDHVSLSATILRGNGASESTEIEWKISRNPHNENESICVFKSPIEGITYFNCYIIFDRLQMNYKLKLKRNVTVDNIKFSLDGEWVKRFFIDKM